MRLYLTAPRFRNQSQCKYYCLVNEHYNRLDSHINRVLRIRNQFKQRNSNKKQFEKIAINQFGRLEGSGGDTLNNFR